jgi:excisionase family DNA binding protein
MTPLATITTRPAGPPTRPSGSFGPSAGPPRLPIARHRGAHRQLGVARALPDGQRPGIDPLLTADDVAALLRVTKAWVYAETRAQRIPHVPLGRYVRYRESAVLDWIAELEQRSHRGAQRVRVGGV